MTNIQISREYFVSGSWPAKIAFVIKLGHGGQGHLVRVENTHLHMETHRLHETRLAADEQTLSEARIRLKNCEELASELRIQVAILEASKGHEEGQ